MGGARTFVGREAERAEIRAALARAAAGQGGPVLLVGEAGTGKTRLADEASDDARALGFEVVWGRCWEGEAPPAYLPWTQVMRAIAAPAAGRAVGPAAVPTDMRAAPAARAHVAPDVAPAPAAGEAAGFELLEAVTADLSAAGARRPLLLVLDDLHAA